MDTKTAISLAGSNKELAALLGISPGAVSQWGARIPQARLWQLQLLRPEWFAKPEFSELKLSAG